MFNSSIQILNKFKLDNLKVIHLNNNKLTSISLLQKKKYGNLKEIYVNDNELESINELKEFKLLTIIEIRNNIINSIENLEDFIVNLPMLKKINLKGNRINIKKEKNIQLLKLLKEKYNDIKIEI